MIIFYNDFAVDTQCFPAVCILRQSLIVLLTGPVHRDEEGVPEDLYPAEADGPGKQVSPGAAV